MSEKTKSPGFIPIIVVPFVGLGVATCANANMICDIFCLQQTGSPGALSPLETQRHSAKASAVNYSAVPDYRRFSLMPKMLSNWLHLMVNYLRRRKAFAAIPMVANP
jgi:hypothetical protein